MPQFSYRARRRNGDVVQGVLDVTDRSAALTQLEKLGLFPVAVQTAGAAEVKRAARTAAPAAPRAQGPGLPAEIRRLFSRQRKPRLQELATFTQQLANLLQSGMPLTVALNSMTHLETRGIPAEVSRSLRQDVMEGKSLSDSLARQNGIFSDLYINMVRAGEQSGALQDVLRRLATHFERFAELRSKFLSALIYPCIVGIVGVLIMFFFMTVMLPKFMTIFDGVQNLVLPTSTRMLMAVSNFFSSYWWLPLLLAVAFGVLFQRYRQTPAGRRSLDQLKMRLPAVGKVIRLNLFGQFCRTLGTLLANGVPVLTALKITEAVIPNTVLKEAIAQTREAVTDGKTIAQPLARSKVFPQLMIDLLKIGEETGDVPGALENLADTYENELTIQLRVLTNLIEPVMIILMAVGVGGLLFSVLSAMFAITSSLNR